MNRTPKNDFSGSVTDFHERVLPEGGALAGYAALIDRYGLAVPDPRTLSAIGQRHRITEKGGWRMFTPRHAPRADLQGHLTFALKYEGLDLAVLNRLFQVVGADAVAALMRAKPTGSYARRIWFLYEWLTGTRLDLPDASIGTYVAAVDPEQQFAVSGENSPRHRVRNNLPGTHEFCPLVFRTRALKQFGALDLAQRAQAVVANVPRDLLSRTAAFLLERAGFKVVDSAFVALRDHPLLKWSEPIGREIGISVMLVGERDASFSYPEKRATFFTPKFMTALGGSAAACPAPGPRGAAF